MTRVMVDHEALKQVVQCAKDVVEEAGGCDHDVGICYCGILRDIEKVEQASPTGTGVYERDVFCSYLVERLIPDLMRDGMEETARDFRTAAEYIANPVEKPARPFTASDWECFGGASSWCSKPCDSDGGRELLKEEEAPVLREFQGGMLTADREGVLFITNDGDFYDLYDVKFRTQAAALAFLNGMPVDFTNNLDKFGFVPST